LSNTKEYSFKQSIEIVLREIDKMVQWADNEDPSRTDPIAFSVVKDVFGIIDNKMSMEKFKWKVGDRLIRWGIVAEIVAETSKEE
jgi:hypothetical protein